MTAVKSSPVDEKVGRSTLKKLVRQNNFPTMIFQGQVESPTKINNEILNSVYDDFNKDSSAKPVNDTEILCWRSARNLHRKQQFHAVRQQIEAALALISLELRYSKAHHLKITSMWANINPPGSSAPAACRPGNLWSGCYGVNVPQGAGNMKFIDPRTINIMNPPKYEKDNKPRDCFTKVTFKPREGHIVIFPAWLYHEVETNLAKADSPAGDYVYVSFSAIQARR